MSGVACANSKQSTDQFLRAIIVWSVTFYERGKPEWALFTDETFPDLSGNQDFCLAEEFSRFPVGGSKEKPSPTVMPLIETNSGFLKIHDFWKFWVSSLLFISRFSLARLK